MTDVDEPFPIPELDPRPITADQYMALAPEKLELWSGFLLAPPEMPESRRALLALLLVNTGLLEAVKLAPRAHWADALARVYGEEPG